MYYIYILYRGVVQNQSKLWFPKTALTPRFRDPFAPQQNRDTEL